MPADRLGYLVHGVTGQYRTLAHESKCLIDRAISLNRNATRRLSQPQLEFAFAVQRPVPEHACGGNIRHQEENYRLRRARRPEDKRSQSTVTGPRSMSYPKSVPSGMTEHLYEARCAHGAEWHLYVDDTDDDPMGPV